MKIQYIGITKQIQLVPENEDELCLCNELWDKLEMDKNWFIYH